VHTPNPSHRRPHLLVLAALVVGLLGAGGGNPNAKGPNTKGAGARSQGLKVTGELRPQRRPSKGTKDPSIPTSAMEALKQGQLARAWRFADNHLRRQPRGRAGHAVMGGVESRMGWAVEALDSFDAGVGARWYGTSGRALHANALRSVGRGAEAADLRRDDLRDDRTAVQLRTWVAMVDDLRAAGEPIAAEDTLTAGLSEHPRSSVLMSVGADLALDRGDVAAAEGWLALIHHYAGPVRRTRHVNLRIALLEGNHERVDGIARALLRVQPGDPQAIAAVAHSLIDQGQPTQAWETLHGVEARRRGDAGLLTAEARALAALGRTDEARALIAFVRARHPLDQDASMVQASLRR